MEKDTIDKLKAKREILKNKLDDINAKLTEKARKARNGQLIAFGIFIEEEFKNFNDVEREALVERVQARLNDRNLERALAGFKRLGWSSGGIQTPADAPKPAGGIQTPRMGKRHGEPNPADPNTYDKSNLI